MKFKLIETTVLQEGRQPRKELGIVANNGETIEGLLGLATGIVGGREALIITVAGYDRETKEREIQVVKSADVPQAIAERAVPVNGETQ